MHSNSYINTYHKKEERIWGEGEEMLEKRMRVMQRMVSSHPATQTHIVFHLADLIPQYRPTPKPDFTA